MLLSGSTARMQEHSEGRGSYGELLEEGRRANTAETAEVEAAIDRDLHRTFPGHPALTARFIERIKNVLVAYSARNPEVSYCQGMNFVTAAILMFVESEEQAFWLLAHVTEEVLVDHYVQSMLGHKVDQQLIEQLVELQLPEVASHLRELALSLSFVTSQ